MEVAKLLNFISGEISTDSKGLKNFCNCFKFCYNKIWCSNFSKKLLDKNLGICCNMPMKISKKNIIKEKHKKTVERQIFKDFIKWN